MSDYNIDGISAYLKKRIAAFTPTGLEYPYGTVGKVADGVVRVKSLGGRRYGELLEFDGGAVGMVLDLEEDGVGAVLLDGEDAVKVDSRVRGTDHALEVGVGDALIGRVVDPIGRPLDGESLEYDEFLPIERSAPAINDRRVVDTPMETGILAIDAMIPIGRGQRELIIGDRQTGKTSIALDTILNQKGGDVICIYCAIGQKASSVAHIIETLRHSGALDYSIVVAATASDSYAMQYLAPYSATSMGEYFMTKGRDVLIVYDDLSKHAVAYRTMSLLLHRPPGREAYPGDVFYLHSRLLERSACLSKEKGGGSMTALPIVETSSGNISAYIPTNVISITDGQIYLENELFYSGVRPAVNTGLSVSRVGRSAQPAAMKKLSGTLRIDLAQYREMAVFARFGADLDASTKKMLSRGECLTRLFIQQNYKPYPLCEKVVLLSAFERGSFEGIKPDDIGEAAARLIEYARGNIGGVMNNIDARFDFSDSERDAINHMLDSWREKNA